MNRPIKFRAFHKPTGKYLSSNRIDALLNGMTVAIWPEIRLPDKIGRAVSPADFSHELRGNPFSMKDLLLEQFIGLLDKNGKEIYEGDIVRGRYGKHTVTWYKEHAGFQPFHGDTNSEAFEEVEIVGNIHENPELLK